MARRLFAAQTEVEEFKQLSGSASAEKAENAQVEAYPEDEEEKERDSLSLFALKQLFGIEAEYKGKARGGHNDALAQSTKWSNFFMVFGTPPARQALLETKMIENILDHLMLKRDSR